MWLLWPFLDQKWVIWLFFPKGWEEEWRGWWIERTMASGAAGSLVQRKKPTVRGPTENKRLLRTCLSAIRLPPSFLPPPPLWGEFHALWGFKGKAWSKPSASLLGSELFPKDLWFFPTYHVVSLHARSVISGTSQHKDFSEKAHVQFHKRKKVGTEIPKSKLQLVKRCKG